VVGFIEMVVGTLIQLEDHEEDLVDSVDLVEVVLEAVVDLVEEEDLLVEVVQAEAGK